MVGVGWDWGGFPGKGGGQLEEYGRIMCTVIRGPMIQIFLQIRKIHRMSPVVFGGFQDFIKVGVPISRHFRP